MNKVVCNNREKRWCPWEYGCKYCDCHDPRDLKENEGRVFICADKTGHKYSCRLEDVIDEQPSGEKPLIRKSWTEFRETGLLWFVNSILHMFGWAICVDDVAAYPSRVIYRGFSETCNTEGYRKVTKFLSENAEKLLKELEE